MTGVVVDEGILFQVYSPETMTVAKTTQKIEEDRKKPLGFVGKNADSETC